MKLYHGSTVDIPHVDLAKSKPNKDFGMAFYLSDDEQQALEMAQFRAEFEEATTARTALLLTGLARLVTASNTRPPRTRPSHRRAQEAVSTTTRMVNL